MEATTGIEMDDRSHMSLARFRALLDAYGADGDRWPPEERDAALALLAQSPEAQRSHDASAQLDALLDRVPAAETSPALVERILAALPEPTRAAVRTLPLERRATRRTQAWRYIAVAAPFAAAAMFVLWLSSETPRTPEDGPVVIAEIGTYDAPTDALLDVPSVEALDRVPAFGCTGSGLGCLDVEPLNNQSALDLEKYV